MSFEGTEERLCIIGHYHALNVYTGFPEKCPNCHSPWGYRHLIDHTNGYDEEDPSTYSAEREESGFDDDWHEDHYGNKYAVKILRYKPTSNEWRIYKPTTDE